MKRIGFVVFLMIVTAAGALTAVQRARMKHRYSGQEITVPGRDGDGVLLAAGWRITPAGRQLPSGDMILSAQVSPDGKTLAFTNTGYTQHQLHIVDLATEKETATFPLERGWSGLAWQPNGKSVLVSGGQDKEATDIYSFQHWQDGSWTRKSIQLTGATKAKTAISSIAVSAGGGLVYAVNTIDGFLYMLDGAGRTVSRISVGDHPFAAKLSRDGKQLYIANIGGAEVVSVDVSTPS